MELLLQAIEVESCNLSLKRKSTEILEPEKKQVKISENSKSYPLQSSEIIDRQEIEWIPLMSFEKIETGRVGRIKKWLSKSDSDRYFQSLYEKVEWKEQDVIMYGKKIMQPRKIAFFNPQNGSFPYTGQVVTSQGWLTELEELKIKLKNLMGIDFNSVFLNLYMDGVNNHISPHSDEDIQLWGNNPVIASISFGAKRKFMLKESNGRLDKPRGERINTYEFDLGHGELLIMAGSTQSHWKHWVPKDKNVLKPRINLTFRVMIDNCNK